MAFDAAQILRQTYAAGAEAMQRAEMLATANIEETAAAEVGKLMGMEVALEADPMAELLDSMEELSFQFEEKSMKRISDRKMGEMQGPRSAIIKAIEAWAALMPDMPGRDFLTKTLRNLRNSAASGRMPDAQDILKALARGSTDSSHMFAMLDILEQALGAEEMDIRALLQQAKTRLVQERGPEIRAGINLAEEVNARATTPQEMQELRDLYRGEVVGFKNPQDCFRSLLAGRGPGGLSDAISFLIAGCGADLKSATPSRDPEALGRILTDLNCVQVLQTVLEKLGQLAARMPREFGDQCLLNGEQMTGRVLDFTEQPFVAASTIAAFVGECGMAKLLAKIDFTRELTRLFRLLSPRLFAKEGDRQRLVDASQEHLDELITRENEEEENVA